MILAQSTPPVSITQAFLQGQFPVGLLLICLGVSVLSLFVAKVLRLDVFLKSLLVRRMPRQELIARLGELALLAERNDPRGMRRIGDRCDWQLFRQGAELLARGAEPPEIASKLEQASEMLFQRRVSNLRRAGGIASGLLIFPVGMLVSFVLGAFGAWGGMEGLLAAGAFAFAMALLVVTSTARWMCEHAETNQAKHTLEAEALIFALSAIRGGASPTDVREMLGLMFGMPLAQSPLKQAA